MVRLRCAGLGVVLSAAVGLAQPVVTPLDALPGTTRTFVYGVSGDGRTAVGRCTGSGFNSDRAFRWTAETGIVGLGLLPDALWNDASAVSRDGSVITGNSGWSGSVRAYRMSDATATDLGVLTASGGWSSYGHALSGDGQVVSGWGTVTNGQRAYRWSAQGGGMVELPVLAGGTTASITDLSYDGSVGVGTCGVGGGVGNRAVRWVGNAIEALPHPAGATYSGAHGVSDDGRIAVGFAGFPAVAPSTPATGRIIRWSPEGAQELPPLPGWEFLAAVSCNATAEVVVAQTSHPTGNLHVPYYFAPGIGAVNLQSYLVSLGVNLDGWSMNSAEGVSDDGSVVVGQATFNGSSTFSWIVTGLPAYPVRACGADVGAAGGIAGSDGRLDNNDFVAFISMFFSADGHADIGRLGGLSGADGRFDNNDFIVFVDRFFAGC